MRAPALSEPPPRALSPARRDDARRVRAVAALLLVLALVPYVVSLGDPPLWDANEPLYAEPPREALETGDWLAPPWNHRPWFAHPPLASWLTMPSYALLGATPFAERLPMALAAIATVLAAASIGRSLGGPRAGVLAGVLLAATPRFWLFARQLSGDVDMTALLTGAFALVLPALRPEGSVPRWRLALAHALVALGTLAKGPVILVLYAVPLVLAARLGRPRVPLARLRPWTFAALVVVLGAPWFVYMTARFGPSFPETYFLHHHLARTFSDDLGGKSWWYYFVALLGDGLPWVLFVPLAAFRGRGARERSPGSVLAWSAALFPLVLFSVAVGKRNVYLLPIYPWIAVLVAPVLLDVWDGVRPALARLASALGALAAAAGTVVVALARRHVEADLALAALPFEIVLLASAVALTAWAIWAPRRAAVATGVGTVWLCLLAGGFALPALGRYMPVPRLAETLVAEAAPGEPAVVYGVSIHSLNFYARRPTVVAKSFAELLAEVPASGRVWVLSSDDSARDAKRDATEVSGLAYAEVAREPHLRLQFGHTVLGDDRTTRDLVLFTLARRPEGGDGAPR